MDKVDIHGWSGEHPDRVGECGHGGASTLGQEQGGFRLALREDPKRASALEGWDPLALAVATRNDLEAVAAALDERGVRHGRVIRATLGWLLSAEAPDGLQVRFYTEERHEEDAGDTPRTSGVRRGPRAS